MFEEVVTDIGLFAVAKDWTQYRSAGGRARRGERPRERLRRLFAVTASERFRTKCAELIMKFQL